MRLVDHFNGCTVFLEHAMLELLGGVVVESFMEGGRVNLVEQLSEGCGVVGLFLFLLWSCREDGCGEEGEEERGE